MTDGVSVELAGAIGYDISKPHALAERLSASPVGFPGSLQPNSMHNPFE